MLDLNQLQEFWDRNPKNRPCVINFLFAFSLRKRLILRDMLDHGILPNMDVIRTINEVPFTSLEKLIRLAGI